MPYTVGQSGVTDYANTTLTTVTRVVADGGVGGSGESAVGGGSSRVALSYTIAANVTNLTVVVDVISGYIAGKSDITVTVNAGIYAYSVVENLAGLRIRNASTGDTVKLVNNGYIVGWGGNGGGVSSFETNYCGCTGLDTYFASLTTPSAGTLAIDYSSLTNTVPLTIENSGYIAGGGGGGGGAIIDDSNTAGPLDPLGGALGGGGAGGGVTYSNPDNFGNRTRATPTSPTGLNGGYINLGVINCRGVTFVRGGGGGFIFPGVGGSIGTVNAGTENEGVGGGSGGSGAEFNFTIFSATPTNAGGTANGEAPDPGGAAAYSEYIGGGGGGWGANGAKGIKYLFQYQAGAAGGPAIKRNSSTITISSGSSRIYGTTIN